MKKLKVCCILSFVLSAVALTVGASFHGYRIHPENVENYNIGIAMGTYMLSAFGLFLIVGLILLIIYKKKKNK